MTVSQRHIVSKLRRGVKEERPEKCRHGSRHIKGFPTWGFAKKSGFDLSLGSNQMEAVVISLSSFAIFLSIRECSTKLQSETAAPLKVRVKHESVSVMEAESGADIDDSCARRVVR